MLKTTFSPLVFDWSLKTACVNLQYAKLPLACITLCHSYGAHPKFMTLCVRYMYLSFSYLTVRLWLSDSEHWWVFYFSLEFCSEIQVIIGGESTLMHDYPYCRTIFNLMVTSVN
jgi:hypothetical protein